MPRKGLFSCPLNEPFILLDDILSLEQCLAIFVQILPRARSLFSSMLPDSSQLSTYR